MASHYNLDAATPSLSGERLRPKYCSVGHRSIASTRRPGPPLPEAEIRGGHVESRSSTTDCCALLHDEEGQPRYAMIHYITTQGVGDAWVGNELRIVRREGIPFVLHSMRRPKATFFASDWAEDLERQTRYLYPLPPLGLALSVAVAPLRFGRRFFAALGNAIFGRRESSRARLACLGHLFVACHWARMLRHEPVSLIHSQWAHSGGSIGMYGAWLLGVPFSFTGHGADLFRERVALEDKVLRADFIACISSFHRDLYKDLGARDDQLVIVYCGIDLDHFSPAPRDDRAGRPAHILSAGRLVEKKGFAYLIDACRILADRGVDFRCTIAGSGLLEATLRRRVEEAGLVDRVALTGRALKQEEIPEFMRGGDLFCLPCVWATDGDVDGLPQMTMEAMACGLPAVSTRLVGIPDLVVHDRTGLLAEPEDAAGLADALQVLIDDPGRARCLADAGREWVRERCDIARCLEPLIGRFRSREGVRVVVEK
jgi:colanic acid/amylovoran biosynthesis glycosyltransferase